MGNGDVMREVVMWLIIKSEQVVVFQVFILWSSISSVIVTAGGQKQYNGVSVESSSSSL